MILSFGARTDIANHYGEWLMNRFRAGFLYTRNPLFPNKVTRYELAPDKVDALLFCSKNYAPFLPHIPTLAAEYRTDFQYTITAYGADVEPRIPSIDESIETLSALSELVGAQKVVWRYDPVLITSHYTAERHFDTFNYIASRVKGKIERCIFNFVEMFTRIEKRMPEIIPLSAEDKRRIAAELSKIAKGHGIPLQTCGMSKDYANLGVLRAGCVTLDRIAVSNKCLFREMPHNGNRRGCLCISSRDAGFYDSCPNLCRYCNTNVSPERVRENRSLHDPNSPLLIGNLKESDNLMVGIQTSFLRNDNRQISLFDL